MLRKIIPVLTALAGLAMLAPTASAADFFAFGSHDDGSRIWKPYVIEKNCTHGFNGCSVPRGTYPGAASATGPMTPRPTPSSARATGTTAATAPMTGTEHHD
jgi:hypothetical protein